MNRAEALDIAKKYVTKDRQDIHGRPEDTFERIAALWNAYLNVEWADIEAHDVAVMLGLLKIARIRHAPQNDDNWVDLAGYAACGAELCDDHGSKEERHERGQSVRDGGSTAGGGQGARVVESALRVQRQGNSDYLPHG